MNNETVKRFDFTIKLRGDDVYDLYLNEEYITHSGSFEKILDEVKKVMRYEFLLGDEM